MSDNNNEEEISKELLDVLDFLGSLSDDELDQIITATLSNLSDKGFIEPGGVTEDGEITYEATELGKNWVDNHSYAKTLSKFIEKVSMEDNDE